MVASRPEISPDWLLWQLADSAWPAGGFGHSGGVEAAFQLGELRGRDDLKAFVEAAIAQSATSMLPFVAAAFDQTEPFSSVDWFCDAFTVSHVANRASRLQGQAFLSTSARALDVPAVSALRQEVLSQELPGHFPAVFGAVARNLELQRESVLRLFLFGQIRGWMSSAVRLGIVGPIEGQGIQASLSYSAEAAVGRAASLPLTEIAQTAPLLDLFQGAHDRLYSRLFQS